MHDLIIVGLGPAAYNCSLYCTRYSMDVKLIGAQPGGQVFMSGEIENYLGYKYTKGQDLAQAMMEQVTEAGGQIVYDTVDKAEKTEAGFRVHGSISGDHEGKILLLATGTRRRKLGVPGEDKYYYKGVTYCATCDGTFYKGLDVAVVGGGNSAVEAALYLADICNSVRIFVRRDVFRADAVLVEKLKKNPKITIEFETQITEIHGEEKMTHVSLNTGEQREIQGLFIEIGADPETALAKDLGVELDDEGYIVVDSGMRTNVPGVLAAGDNSTGSEKFAQIATAVGEGAIAAKAAHEIFQHS